MKLLERIQGGGIYTIAEMSANHAGKLENAYAIIKAAKQAGADCLKIQTYTADTLTLNCDNEYFRIHGGLWDGQTFYDLYQKASTPWQWQRAIKEACEKEGLDFLSTPFDFTAVDFLESLNVEAYKIASPELNDIPLIEYVASKGKPMLISTGMATQDEILAAVEACRAKGNEQVILLKCTSEYPAQFADMNLRLIPDMIRRFGVPVGLSDHSMGHLAPVTAVALGACVIEKHFCLDRAIKNPDSAFSMEPAEFARMVQAVNQAKSALGQPVYGLSEGESASIRRSLFASRDIQAGEAFTRDNVRSVRPAYGLPPVRYYEVLKRKAACGIPFGTPLKEEHLV